MSLLSIVQDACRHPSLTLPVPVSVVGNDQSSAPALLMAAKEELDSLATRHNWQRLAAGHTFLATASVVQLPASAISSNFDRMVNDTLFNVTQKKQIVGPISPEDWVRNFAMSTMPVNPVYRISNNTILIQPAPTSGDSIFYEYITHLKARSNVGASQTNWQADSDTCVFREDIVTLGVVWRYRRGKGYPYNADQEEYERRVSDAISRDGARTRITTDGRFRIARPMPPRVPDTLTGL